jgi:hypothetical protein
MSKGISPPYEAWSDLGKPGTYLDGLLDLLPKEKAWGTLVLRKANLKKVSQKRQSPFWSDQLPFWHCELPFSFFLALIRTEWAEIQVGRTPSGPKSRWAEIQVGRNPGGPKSRWAEIQVGKNPGGPGIPRPCLASSSWSWAELWPTDCLRLSLCRGR